MLRPALVLASWLATAAVSADQVQVPPPPELAGESHYLLDYSSGAVLAEKRSGERLPPASLTKLMSAYVVFDELAAGRLGIDDRVLVSEKAWRMRGSRMFIEVDTEVSVDDLLHGMIVQSGNDASVALAEHIAGSEEAFVELMNAHAERLGMTDSRFANTTGLPAREHYSTARDLAVLARAIIAEFPERYWLYSEKEFTYNEISQRNRNALLFRDAGVDGLKTGHTSAAGYCLVSSAEREGMRLIAVVRGMPSPKVRADGSQALLEYGFEHFETHRLFARGEAVAQTRVWMGAPEEVALGLAEDLYVTVPRGTYDALAATMTIQTQVLAPIDESLDLGELQVRYREETIRNLPLVALHTVSEAGFLTKVTDGIRLWLH
jgi:D-alanyl-D-alanine carboxypeptidase (penicillin-binding protein 5/6)